MASLVWYKILWEAGEKTEPDRKYNMTNLGKKEKDEDRY